MRVAIYARVSTLDKVQDPSLQTDELLEYCHRRGWTVAGQYVDRGVSGAKDSRPELDRMMADARARRLDAVCVWKFDRYARSLKHLVDSLAEFEALGISFVSVTDQIDLATPAGRLRFHIIAAMAEFERSLIQQRVRAGIARAKADGRRIGRPRAVIDSARVVALRSAGRCWAQIATSLATNPGVIRNVYKRACVKPAAQPWGSIVDSTGTA